MDQKLELNQLVSETLLPGLTFTDWMCRTPTPAVSHKPCVSGQTSPHFTGEALSHLPTAHSASAELPSPSLAQLAMKGAGSAPWRMAFRCKLVSQGYSQSLKIPAMVSPRTYLPVSTTGRSSDKLVNSVPEASSHTTESSRPRHGAQNTGQVTPHPHCANTEQSHRMQTLCLAP